MKCRNNESTMVKIRKYDGEKSIARWWKVEITKPRWWYNFVFFTIVLSNFHHRCIVVSLFQRSLSFYRVFTIVLSCFHHRTTVFSLSYYRLFTIGLSPPCLTSALILFQWINRQWNILPLVICLSPLIQKSCEISSRSLSGWSFYTGLTVVLFISIKTM